MNVVVVYHFFPNYRADVLAALARTLEPDRLVLVSGVTRPGQEDVPEAENLNIQYVRNRWFADRVLWQSGLAPHLRDADVIIFLGNWFYLSTWYWSAKLRRRGARILYWTHGWKKPDTALTRAIRVRFYKGADELLVYSDHGRKVGLGEGFPADRIFVVGNAIPPVHALGREQGRRFVFVGRLIESKSPHTVLEAAALLSEQLGQPVKVRFIGSGPLRTELERQARATAGVEAEFVGAVHDPVKIGALFSDAFAAVFPSSAGLGVPHAIAHGIPAIVNDSPEMNGPEHAAAVEAFPDLVFSTGDIGDLCRAMRQSMSVLPSDTALDVAQQYSADAVALRIAERIDTSDAAAP